MKKLLLASVLAFGLPGCKNYMYDHTANNVVDNAIFGTTNISKTWKGMGFTIDEYKIYTSANMTPQEALPWKQANISPKIAVQYYQQWKALNISNEDAVFYVKNTHATPEQYQEVIKTLENYSITSDPDLITNILKQMQNGIPANKALSNIMTHKAKEEKLQEQSAFSPEVINMCGGIPPSIYEYTAFRGTKNPYGFKNKCYIINTPIDTVKWLSDHQVLIVAMPQIDISNVIYIYGDDPIKLDQWPVVIGTDPETFTTAFGGETVFPSFRVIGYKNANQQAP